MLRDVSTRGIVSNKTAFAYLDDIADDYRKKHPFGSLEFSSALKAGCGKSGGFHPEDLVVGIGGLSKESRLPVDEQRFVRALVAEYHEIHHARQYCEIQHEDTTKGRDLSVVWMATRNNPFYAGLNYLKDPREIDAEREGMLNAYVFCAAHFGEEKSDDLLCQYVNKRIRENVSFIYPANGRYYRDVADIFHDIDAAYDRSIFVHRKYDVRKGLTANDQIAEFLDQQPRYKDTFLNEPDGHKQDRMAAAVALDYGGASYEERMLPGLQGVTISSAFTCDESHANRAAQADEKFGYIAGASDSECDEYEP